jgi:hypothetical protein
MERVTLLSPEAVITAPTLEQLCLPRPLLAVRSGAPPVRGGDVGQAAVLLRQNVEALEAGVSDPRRLYNVMSRAW